MKKVAFQMGLHGGTEGLAMNRPWGDRRRWLTMNKDARKQGWVKRIGHCARSWRTSGREVMKNWIGSLQGYYDISGQQVLRLFKLEMEVLMVFPASEDLRLVLGEVKAVWRMVLMRIKGAVAGHNL